MVKYCLYTLYFVKIIYSGDEIRNYGLILNSFTDLAMFHSIFTQFSKDRIQE